MERHQDRKLRLIDFSDLQLKASETISRKIGSRTLANWIIKRPSNLSLINPPQFISLNSNNQHGKFGYCGFTQEGIVQVPDTNKKGSKITQVWKIDAVYYTGGGWNIKTNYGERKFIASCTPKGEVEIKATLPLLECLQIMSERKKTNDESQRMMIFHVFHYLNELRQRDLSEEIISATFSSTLGKSHIDLPLE